MFALVVIAAAAVGVSLLVRYLEDQGIDSASALGLQACEYVLFVADLALFARYLWKTSTRTWASL